MGRCDIREILKDCIHLEHLGKSTYAREIYQLQSCVTHDVDVVALVDVDHGHVVALVDDL